MTKRVEHKKQRQIDRPFVHRSTPPNAAVNGQKAGLTKLLLQEGVDRAMSLCSAQSRCIAVTPCVNECVKVARERSERAEASATKLHDTIATRQSDIGTGS